MNAVAEREETQDQIGKSDAFVVEADGDRLGRSLFVICDEISVKISGSDTGGAFAVMENRTMPMGGPPLHLHHEQDEWWYILEGRYRFVVDGREFEAGPGATVFAPKGSRHAFQNIGSTPGRTLVTVVPAGLDEFFEEMDAAVPRGTVPAIGVVVPLFEKYGMELLGSPLG